MYFNIYSALCRLSTESIMYVLLDVAPTPEIIIKKRTIIYIAHTRTHKSKIKFNYNKN